MVLAAAPLCALLLVTGCGSSEEDGTTTEPTETTLSTDETTTTIADDTTSTAADQDESRQAAIEVVDRYATAVADGDLEAAWELIDQRSRDDLGGFEDFEGLASALTEGIGAWAGAEDRTEFANKVNEVNGATAWAVTLLGTVAQEGPPALSSASMMVYTTGDGATVSPFEDVFDVKFVTFDPDYGATIEPAAAVTVEVPEDVQPLLVAFDEDPVDDPGTGPVLEVEPASPLDDGDHALTVAVERDGALASVAAHYVIGAAGENGSDDAGSTTTTDQAMPASAKDWAIAVFDAWTSGDDGRLRELTTDPAYRALVDRPPSADDDWPAEPACDGAVGSTYCQWIGTDGVEALLLRVSNQAVDAGEPAVIDASFGPPR